MGIIYDEHKRIFSLHTKHASYQMQIGTYGHLLHLYYGKKISGTTEYLLSYKDRGFSGNPYDTGKDRTYSLDSLPLEYPTEGIGDFRTTCFSGRDLQGVTSNDFRYKSHVTYIGKYSLSGLPASYATDRDIQENDVMTLCITLVDQLNHLELDLLYGVFEAKDIITRSVVIRNMGQQKYEITKVLSAGVDYIYGDYDWIHFYGRHAMEQNPERAPLHQAIQSIRSKRGASSHQHNPFVILADKNTTEDFGNCFGYCFVYSGSFCAHVDVDQYHQTRLVMGINDEGFSHTLYPGQVFTAPEVIMSFSHNGLTTLSHQLHDIIRHNVCRGKYKTERRPILINNWEATYFDFDGQKILDIAEQAARLGVEMFVLDDGWFGSRDSDNRSLGDWFVNEKKLGCTLSELVGKINQAGLKFGLWFEPEMISEESELFEQHPDWALRVPGRNPVRSRYQLVLDYSRTEVVDYIFERICRILDQANIEYIKWDFNRSISDVFSATSGTDMGGVLHQYMLGLYRLLENIVTRYPDLLIETCSGGGGRFDTGMLYYSPQIWTSDNTDAIDRLSIQEGCSYAYPISAVGSHVSAVPNHQTGRSTSFETRGIVAMAGCFGYELDLSKITDDEKEMVTHQIQDYKSYWPLIHGGKYYRLTSVMDKGELAAWMFVSEDGTESLLSVVTLNRHGNALPTYIKLKGLREDLYYSDTKTGSTFCGSALMNAGYHLPDLNDEYWSVQVHLKSLD